MTKYKYKTDSLYWILISFLIVLATTWFGATTWPRLNAVAAVLIIVTLLWFGTKYYKQVLITNECIIVNRKRLTPKNIERVEIANMYQYDGNKGKAIDDWFKHGSAMPNSLSIKVSYINGDDSKVLTLIPDKYTGDLVQGLHSFLQINSIPVIARDKLPTRN